MTDHSQCHPLQPAGISPREIATVLSHSQQPTLSALAGSSAGRWRPPYLRSMLELQIGESVDICPEDGDTLEALWARVRRQSSRYQSTGKYFHLYKRADSVSVQRVAKGLQGKLARFRRMAVGEKTLCEDPFNTKKEKANLRRRLNYLSDPGFHYWLERHASGELYYRCVGIFTAEVPYWFERPTDDGSDLLNAHVVCGPFKPRSMQEFFQRIKVAILAQRAAANANANANGVLDR